ncbi:hypothetical protein [Pedobacter sp. NJ-S-72]
MKAAVILFVVTALKIKAVAAMVGAVHGDKLGGKCTPKLFRSSSSIAF